LSARVTVSVQSPESALVRIAPEPFIRLIDAAKATLLVLILAPVLMFVRRQGDLFTLPWLWVAAVLALAAGIYVYLKAGETVRITPSSVRMTSPWHDLVVSRFQQAAPVYTSVDASPWRAQRWQDERGSGVLLFGDRERGVRFGVWLDAADAAQVLAVFDAVPVLGVPVAFVSRSALRRVVVDFAPWAVAVVAALGAVQLEGSGFAIGAVAVLGLVGSSFALEAAWPSPGEYVSLEAPG